MQIMDFVENHYIYEEIGRPKVRFKDQKVLANLICKLGLFLSPRLKGPMSTVAGGGDLGIVGETIAHPKPADSTMAGPMSAAPDSRALFPVEDGHEEQVSSQALKMDTGSGDNTLRPEKFTEGEMNEEEEDVVEVILEEGEVQEAGQWTILARFYSLRVPNQAALFDDMRRAWRLRADMSYKSLRDNMFIITFSAEGDYEFVLKGGPWIHRGDALLVARFDGLSRPSEVPLETVPIWVRIYDLPLVLMTKARGELYGSKLGQVREVDVGDDGRNKHDFFRIRVDLSVKRPLKSKLAIKMLAQGKEVTKHFDLWYERVPHFCFICGYLGHSDKECNRKGVNNDQPFKFLAELRCSPLKPFERKVSKVKVPSSSGAVRNLFFRGAGSASSSSSRQKQGDQGEDLVPPRVDAHDGFESAKKEGDTQIDEQLAGYAEKMKVGETEVQKVSLPGREGASHKRGPEIRLDGVEDTTSLPSCEMIPAIKTISQQASYGDELSEDCSGEDRREPQTQGATKKSGRVMQALLEYQQTVEESSKSVFESGVSSRALKRSRKTEGVVTGKEKEATSPGAAGQLTGPMVGSCQEQ